MKEVRIVIGGPQGAGLETAAQVLTTAYAGKGYRVYSTREYFSNIKGRHSYIHLRVNTERLPRAPREKPHIIAALDAETVFTHFVEAVENTILVYDKSYEDTRLERIPSMEAELKERVGKLLRGKGYEDTVKGAVDYAREELGAKPVTIDTQQALRRLAEKLGSSFYRVKRYSNTVLIAAIAAMTGLGLEDLQSGFEKRFRGRSRIVEENIELASIVYEALSRHRGVLGLAAPVRPPSDYFVVSGNDVVAMGKVVAGLRFQSYYPITPAADESFALEAREVLEVEGESLGGIVVFQTEDEIAAIAAAIGASLTGARASTSTSGPGFDLMVEALGWAGINEAPVVITYYQRGGPSTGLPTRGGQQDLYSALFSGHGEFPRIVVASGDHEEAFYDSIKAFNWAERYQLPVIHLLDKFLANSIVSLEPPQLDSVVVDRGSTVSTPDPPEYRRFDKKRGPISARAFIGQENIVTWYTGDEHDEWGHISEDPVNRIEMHRARMEKIRIADSEIPEEGERAILYRSGDDFLLIGWGSVKGAVLEALGELERKGYHGSYLHLRVFEPFPSRYVSRILSNYPSRRVIAVEANYLAQASRIVSMNTGFMVKRRVLKWTGRPIYVEELVEGVEALLVDNSREEVVLGYGA